MIDNAIAQALASGLLGLVAGVFHLVALRFNVVLYGAGGRLSTALALHAFRLAAVCMMLWLLAQVGAAALLAATAGFTLARLGALCLQGRVPC